MSRRLNHSVSIRKECSGSQAEKSFESTRCRCSCCDVTAANQQVNVVAPLRTKLDAIFEIDGLIEIKPTDQPVRITCGARQTYFLGEGFDFSLTRVVTNRVCRGEVNVSLWLVEIGIPISGDRANIDITK